jgi:hypothetical protein
VDKKVTEDNLERKSELLEKLKQGTINRNEAQELKVILEREREDASRQGNALLVLGIALLLGFLVQYLSEEKIIDKITKFFSGRKR